MNFQPLKNVFAKIQMEEAQEIAFYAEMGRLLTRSMNVPLTNGVLEQKMLMKDLIL